MDIRNAGQTAEQADIKFFFTDANEIGSLLSVFDRD
jgi:hypothetical protein